MILWFDPFWQLVSWNFMKLILKAAGRVVLPNLLILFSSEMKWAWVAWSQKDNVLEQKQGCTVKCYSLCEPKIQAEVLLIQQERVPMASGEGDEIEWELLSDPRGRGVFCRVTYKRISFWDDEKKLFFSSIAAWKSTNIIFCNLHSWF